MAGMRVSVLIHAITSLICFAAASPALAGRSADAENPGACQSVTSGIEEVSPSEPIGVGAGIVLDEHLSTNGSRDQDYNGGGELTLSGERGPLASFPSHCARPRDMKRKSGSFVAAVLG